MMTKLLPRLHWPRMHWLRAVEYLFWIASGAAALRAGALWVATGNRTPTLPAAPFEVLPRVALFDADSLADAIQVLEERELFRSPSIGATVRTPLGGQSIAPRSIRPSLILRGVTGGPPWQVVLEGVPGRSGSVVLRSGEEIGGLKIRGVVHDTVLIRGPDTTWRLIMRPL